MRDAVRERRVERTSKTKAWLVIHVATDMTVKPMRADVRMSRASCSRIGMRILNRRKSHASLVRRMKKSCVVFVFARSSVCKFGVLSSVGIGMDAGGGRPQPK